MMSATTSGWSRAISWVACLGQSKNFGFASPLETRESYTGATTPVAAVRLPSDGPREPASESPPIQSLSGALVVNGDRHFGLVSTVVVGWGSVVTGSRAATVGCPVAPLPSSTPVSHSAAPAVAIAA